MDATVRTSLLNKYCRYYKGGNINPFPPRDSRSLFWVLEWEFVNNYYDKDELLEREYIVNFVSEFPDQLNKASYGSIMTELKAFFFARYYNNGGSAEGFTDFLDSYLQMLHQ